MASADPIVPPRRGSNRAGRSRADAAPFDEHWQPNIVARFNKNDFRIVKVNGEFVWHKHDDTDDFLSFSKDKRR